MTKNASLHSIAGESSPGIRVSGGFDDQEVGRVALKAFFGIAAAWQLTREEARTLLGEPSESTYYRWRSGKVSSVPRDTIERISVLLGIYKSLHILLPVSAQADTYVRRENTEFAGETALGIMLRGNVEDLYRVRRYLDAWRG